MKSLLLAVLLLTLSGPLAAPAKVVHEPPPKAVTADDKCTAWVVWSESRGESLRGARAVLDTVIARMHKRKMSACQVVREHKQFQGYRPGVVQKVPKEALTRLEELRSISPVAENCDYFHATYVHPPWRLKMKRCKRVDNQIFYKESEHGKASSNRR